MAFTELTPIVLDARNKPSTVATANVGTPCAAQGSKYGVYFKMTERDDKYLLYVQNGDSSAKNVTIKAGNEKIFGSGNDLVFSVAGNSTALVKLDSCRFKNAQDNPSLQAESGVEHLKGCVVVEGANTNVKVALIQMPM